MNWDEVQWVYICVALALSTVALIVAGVAERRASRYDWMRAVRDGIRDARSDVKNYGLFCENPALHSAIWSRSECNGAYHRVYDKLYIRLVKERLASRGEADRAELAARLAEPDELRYAKDTAVRRYLILLTDRVAELEGQVAVLSEPDR